MWYSVIDKLPEVGADILTFEGEYKHGGRNGFHHVISVEEVSSFMLACISGEEYSCSYSHVTHWMPLPLPPGVHSMTEPLNISDNYNLAG